MFTSARLLCNWRDQRPSNQDDLDSSVTRETGRVYYMGVDLLPISFLYRRTWLLLGCVLNGTPCIRINSRYIWFVALKIRTYLTHSVLTCVRWIWLLYDGLLWVSRHSHDLRRWATKRKPLRLVKSAKEGHNLCYLHHLRLYIPSGQRLPVANFGNSAFLTGDVSYIAIKYCTCSLSLAVSAPLYSLVRCKHSRASSDEIGNPRPDGMQHPPPMPSTLTLETRLNEVSVTW
jgi:hypothetical protein